MWYSAIISGGSVVTDERATGTLELLIAAPAPTALVILGRVSASTFLSLIGIPLVVLTARLLGAELAIIDGPRALTGLVALAISTVSITLLFASAFVFARSAVVIQNLIPFPLYILGGIAFPVALLPDWAQPLSALVALSWVAELLQSSVTGAAGTPPLPALGASLLLALLYAASGQWLFARVERSIRANGKVSLTQ